MKSELRRTAQNAYPQRAWADTDSITIGAPLMIADLTHDSRPGQNPVTRADPTVRSFDAVPISSRDVQPIGTLVVFDQQTRALTTGETTTYLVRRDGRARTRPPPRQPPRPLQQLTQAALLSP